MDGVSKMKKLVVALLVILILCGCESKEKESGLPALEITGTLEDVEKMSEAEEGAGFGFIVPSQLADYEGRKISYVEGQLIQVLYGSEDNNLCMRKAKGQGNCSGDAEDYENVQELTYSGRNIIAKGNNGRFQLLIWLTEEYSYSVKLNHGRELADILNMIEIVE